VKYGVQSSHCPVQCPQSSTICIDPSSAGDASSYSSVSASLVHRSNQLCRQYSTFCVAQSSGCDVSSSYSASASASSLSSTSCFSTSLVPMMNLLSSVAGCHLRLMVQMVSHWLLLPLHHRNPCCPLASRGADAQLCNCYLSGCLGKCFESKAPQQPLRRSHCSKA
jgi:hypothetical protein